MLKFLRFVSSVYFDLHCMIQNKQNVEVSYARALRKYPLKEPISLVPKFGFGLVRYDYADTTPVPAGDTLQYGQAISPMQVSPAAPAPPPMFGQQQAGKKPQAKSQQPTFLGQGANPTNTGQKTLMGQ